MRRIGSSGRRVGIVAGSLAALLAAASLADAQDIEEAMQATVRRYAEAQARHLDLISPRNFGRAADRLARAQKERREGGRIEEIQKKLRESNDALGEAEALQEIGEVLMRGALSARAAALAANAPEFAELEWAAAEKKAEDAGSKVEDGDQNDARSHAREAETLYRQAELQAVRNSVLGLTRRLRKGALEAGASDYAPRTLAEADTLLRRADESIARNPSEPSSAADLSSRAAAEYEHATWMARLADSVRRREVSAEELIRRHERELGTIAAPFGFETDFSRGSGPVTDQVVASIHSLQEDRSRLEATLAGREEDIRLLRLSADSLEARLARLEEREAAISVQLRERQRREQTLREVQALFEPAEAEVIVGVDRITLRLIGLTFDSGSDKIRPEDYSLLTKVQQGIRAFPGAQIIVEGHTDSQGNDQFNQALSTRRAIAVREYVLANMAISADRIRAVGYGESRPIARDDTADGRARNRRIDVVLELAES